MNIEFHSYTTLHLSLSPSVKSWSILFGILSVGLGAAFYNPDEHYAVRFAYLFGCLILGLHFFDDWEDCVIDQIQRKITLRRRNWLEVLTSRCTAAKTLVLDANNVMAIQVSPIKKNKYRVELVLRNGSSVPISETTSSSKSHEEMVADCITRILGLDRMQTFYGEFDDSDDDTHSMSTVSHVENLQRSLFQPFEENKDDGSSDGREVDGGNSTSSTESTDEESIHDF